jgi:hypothetical protein
MDAQTLIDDYRKSHGGKSTHIDKQMALAEQALKDAAMCQDRKDEAFTFANLYLARATMYRLLEAIPAPDTVRRLITHIYAMIDNDICTIRERG